MRRELLVALAIVAVALFGYPLLSFAGGAPRFPTRAECVRPAAGDAPDLHVVYGRFDQLPAAESLLADITEVGFVGAELQLDGCGNWMVLYDGIETYAQGEALAAQVREQGFEARVEVRG
jgi:hypothetical protein